MGSYLHPADPPDNISPLMSALDDESDYFNNKTVHVSPSMPSQGAIHPGASAPILSALSKDVAPAGHNHQSGLQKIQMTPMRPQQHRIRSQSMFSSRSLSPVYPTADEKGREPSVWETDMSAK